MAVTGLGSSLHGSGSAFLTGAAPAAAGAGWGPLGYGIAAGAANLAGQNFGNKSVNFRGKFARKQAAHNRAQIRPNQAELMKSMDDSGLHRLAALGITPGAGSQQPMIPGQNVDTGSAIGQGINTAMQAAQTKEARAQAQTIAGLQVEEQGLRNDWLRSQIARSNMALMKEAANRTQDNTTPGPGPTEPGKMVFSQHHSMDTGETTGSEAASDRYGEIVGEGQGIVNTGYDTAGALLPKTFGDWWIDNVTKAKPSAKLYPNTPGKGYIIVRKPVPRPKYPTRAHKSRRGRY